MKTPHITSPIAFPSEHRLVTDILAKFTTPPTLKLVIASYLEMNGHRNAAGALAPGNVSTVKRTLNVDLETLLKLPPPELERYFTDKIGNPRYEMAFHMMLICYNQLHQVPLTQVIAESWDKTAYTNVNRTYDEEIALFGWESVLLTLVCIYIEHPVFQGPLRPVITAMLNLATN